MCPDTDDYLLCSCTVRSTVFVVELVSLIINKLTRREPRSAVNDHEKKMPILRDYLFESKLKGSLVKARSRLRRIPGNDCTRHYCYIICVFLCHFWNLQPPTKLYWLLQLKVAKERIFRSEVAKTIRLKKLKDHSG